MASKPQQTSEDTKTIVTVLLLVFTYPIGVIVMWVWTSWPIWLKILISLVFIIAFLGIFAAIILVAINPMAQIKKAQQVQMQQKQYEQVVTVTPTVYIQQ